jgi:hypothetical protein
LIDPYFFLKENGKKDFRCTTNPEMEQRINVRENGECSQ